jgi:hypothetical protein
VSEWEREREREREKERIDGGCRASEDVTTD